MTTSTLDLVDWATILDDEPACENPEGCDHAATHRLIWTCRCSSKLACLPCGAHEVVAMEQCLAWYSTECQCCGLVQYPEVVSDLIRLVPL